MSSKNISLKKSTYEQLKSLKKDDESFSDLIERLTKNKTPKYSDLAGILSKTTIKAIQNSRIKRKKHDEKEFRKTVEKFGEEE